MGAGGIANVLFRDGTMDACSTIKDGENVGLSALLFHVHKASETLLGFFTLNTCRHSQPRQ